MQRHLSDFRGGLAGQAGTVRQIWVVAIGCLVLPGVRAQQKTIIEVDDIFNGRELVLQAGQTLKVSLSENASTGHRWSVPPELKSKLTGVLNEQEDTADTPTGPQ
jgi:hypothetical protein